MVIARKRLSSVEEKQSVKALRILIFPKVRIEQAAVQTMFGPRKDLPSETLGPSSVLPFNFGRPLYEISTYYIIMGRWVRVRVPINYNGPHNHPVLGAEPQHRENRRNPSHKRSRARAMFLGRIPRGRYSFFCHSPRSRFSRRRRSPGPYYAHNIIHLRRRYRTKRYNNII